MTDGVALSFDDTVGALRAIVARSTATDDRLGYFAAMYLAVTTAVRQRGAEGRFADAARMQRFVASFAGRYLDALAAWRRGARCAESWRIAFAAAGKWSPIVLQHLLLGMNAHINLDLGVAAAALDPEGSLEAVHADFEAINDVLGELVDGCEAALSAVSPWIDLVDRIGGPGDEQLIRFSLGAARRQAWTVALRLRGSQGPERDAAIAAVDAATARVARVVEHPGVAASTLLLAVRSRERARPAEVIRLLAAVRPTS